LDREQANMFGVDALQSGWAHGAGAGCGVSASGGAGVMPADPARGGCAASGAGAAAAVDYDREAGLAGMLQALQQSLGANTAVADTLSARLESLLGALADGASGAAFTADAVLRQKTTLQFVTQEGDVVDLTLRTRTALDMAGAAGSGADGVVAAGSARVIAGSRLAIHVQGNLNDEEMAAIQDVLTQVEDLAAQFYAGSVDTAFAAASALNIDGSQLAAVALDMRQSLRLHAAAAVIGSAAPAAPAAPTAAAAAGTAPAAPADAAPGAVVATAGGYLAQALNQLGAAGAAAVQVSMKLKLQLLLLATAAGPTPAAQPGTGTAAGAAADPAVVKLAESVQALG
jgi:hypothetical protein